MVEGTVRLELMRRVLHYGEEMNMPEPIVPREHGAWAVLAVPYLVAAVIAQGSALKLLLVAAALLGAFMAYLPAQMVIRHYIGHPSPEAKLRQAWLWGSVYIGIGMAAAVPLLLQGYLLLVPIGLLGVAAFTVNFLLTRRAPKTVAGDLVSVAGLTLSAPAAYYTVKGTLDATALTLWLVNLLFFGGSVLYVHMKINAVSARKESLRAEEKLTLGRLNLLYHAAVIGVVAGFAWTGMLPSFAPLAFVPMAVHAIYGTVRLSRRVRFRNLGFLLLAHSLVFALIFVGAQ